MSAHSFANDPTLSPRLFPLLDTVFPGLSAHARRPAPPGGRWEDASTPFLHLDPHNLPLAHVDILFSPDRLDLPHALPVPHRHDNLHLMAHGPLPAEPTPFMIPPPHRC